MSSSPFNRALLRGLLAGAVVLTGTACSRSDRTESGSNNRSTVLPDSGADAVQPSGTAAAAGTVTDTAQPNTPRAEATTPSDSAAGYVPMERDTSAAVEMARDTSTAADQLDTLAVPDTAGIVQASDSGHAGAVVAAGAAGAAVAAAARDGEDRDNGSASPSEIHHAEASDSGHAGAVVAAGAAGAAVAATAGRDNDAGDNRSVAPEDSTEILGQVTTDSTEIPAYETADEQIINPTDEVGAAAIASDVTGAAAVALMSREGVRCAIVDPEENEAVRWDMSSTPVTLNPCGMGSMVLSKVWSSVE